MLNLIPVVMFLLMQGAGGQEMSLRQQQALLDLAQRVQAARAIGELETELHAQAGVGAKDLAFWIQLFGAAQSQVTQTEPPILRTSEPLRQPKPGEKAQPGWSESVHPRDGPSAS